jgi:CheY-like chemotaxis protein
MLGPNDSADLTRQTDSHDFEPAMRSAIRPAFDRIHVGQLISPALLFREQPRSKRSATNRVVVIDDHPIFLQGLSSCLRQRGIGVCGHVSSSRSASGSAMAWLADVVLADCFRTEDLDKDYFKHLRNNYPGAQALVVIEAAEAELVERLLKAGALGCISRDKRIGDFLEAIETVGNAEIYVDKQLALELVTKWVRFPSASVGRSQVCRG